MFCFTSKWFLTCQLSWIDSYLVTFCFIETQAKSQPISKHFWIVHLLICRNNCLKLTIFLPPFLYICLCDLVCWLLSVSVLIQLVESKQREQSLGSLGWPVCITPLLLKLHRLPVCFRVQFKMLVMI